MKQSVIVFLLASALLSCAAKQIQLESELIASEDNSEYLLDKDIKISAKNTKSLVLKANTRWNVVGQIEQGTVFRTKDQAVVVNSYNVYEADIVVENGKVIGYYISINKTFVPARVSNIELTKGNS